jgi:hypothetical protein
MMDEPTETPAGRWITTEMGQVWKPASKPKRPSQHSAHNDAKAELRKVLSNWKARTRISAYYIPYFVGKVWLGEGRNKRPAYIGKPGVADCFVATMGCVIACEVKTGSGDISALQASFRERWTKTMNPHIVYRKPADLTDCLDQIAASKGLLF